MGLRARVPPPPPPPPPPPLLLLLLPVVAAASGVSASGAAPSGAQCLGAVCYGLFWGARSFSEAVSGCAAGGGHLMTVRSTVAAEAAAVLLGGRAGGAWLGLRRPDGSPCAPEEEEEEEGGKPLRGFLWVTGDERTDYEAWAEPAPSRVACEPRCALLSERLSWEERACDARADGFLCEYSYPGGTCGPLQVPVDAAAVSYLTPFGARESDLVAAPPGTRAEVAGLDAILECVAQGSGGPVRWGSASPGAWDCRLENGGCQHHCVPSPSGGALCMCTVGYALGADGRSCVDVDDCQATPGPCEQRCVNTQGGFECLCEEGYELVGGSCLARSPTCEELMCEHECAHVKGQYGCICYEGYAPDPQNPRKCVMFCNQTKCPPECDPHTGDDCYCADGFILEEGETKVCLDIDECASGACLKLECINVPGSYTCICPGGQLCLEPPDEPDYSGEAETYSPTPAPSFIPPKGGEAGRSRGVLIAIIVTSVLGVTALAAILGYLVRKHCTLLPTAMDYKCQQPETGVPLQQVVTPDVTPEVASS